MWRSVRFFYGAINKVTRWRNSKTLLCLDVVESNHRFGYQQIAVEEIRFDCNIATVECKKTWIS